jgi:hypothetical protein
LYIGCRKCAITSNFLFSNIRVHQVTSAGLRKREDEFWDYVRQFEVVGLVGTWVEEQSWEKIERTLPKEYKWAKRERKRGRAAGGIITGVTLGIEEKRKKKGGRRRIHGKKRSYR